MNELGAAFQKQKPARNSRDAVTNVFVRLENVQRWGVESLESKDKGLRDGMAAGVVVDSASSYGFRSLRDPPCEQDGVPGLLSRACVAKRLTSPASLGCSGGSVGFSGGGAVRVGCGDAGLLVDFISDGSGSMDVCRSSKTRSVK